MTKTGRRNRVRRAAKANDSPPHLVDIWNDDSDQEPQSPLPSAAPSTGLDKVKPTSPSVAETNNDGSCKDLVDQLTGPATDVPTDSIPIEEAPPVPKAPTVESANSGQLEHHPNSPTRHESRSEKAVRMLVHEAEKFSSPGDCDRTRRLTRNAEPVDDEPSPTEGSLQEEPRTHLLASV